MIYYVIFLCVDKVAILWLFVGGDGGLSTGANTS